MSAEKTERIKDLKRRISAEPDDASLYYKLGGVYIALNEPGDAINALRKAVDLDPRKTRYRLLLANAYARYNQHSRAKKQYEMVLSIDPTKAEAHKYLGLLFEFHLRDPAAALNHYRNYVRLGGKDARVLKRYDLLRQEIEHAKPRRHYATDAPIEEQRLPAVAKLQNAVPRLLKLSDRVGKEIAAKQNALTRLILAFGMFVTMFLCLDFFPTVNHVFVIIICLGIAFQTALDPRFGIATGLILMFFPVAFYSAPLAYLYATGIVLLFLLYRADKPGFILAVLLTPVLLKFNVAYAIPLGAAIFLGARRALKLGIVASIAGLGCMIAADIRQLGPLSANYAGTPISLATYEEVDLGVFFALGWMKSLFSPVPIPALSELFDSIFPALLDPPIAVIQIAAWGIAGYAAGRLYQKRTPVYLASALAGGAVVFLLQAMIIKNILGSPYFSSMAVLRCFIYSGIIVSGLVLLRIGVKEEKPLEETEAADLVADLEDVSWDSIGGLEDVKREIQMATRYQFQRGFSRFGKKFDVAPAKGILFYGPPGCGKTMFAKVLAKDVGASFFAVKGSDFRSKWYGETEQNLSALFAKARQKAPSIIFFDEIDSILEKRSDGTLGDSPEAKVVALFLTELDGITPLRHVLVVGATNEPDSIDPAVLRPGRFDKLIYIPLPDRKGREKIFRIHLGRKPLTAGIDYEKLAKSAERFSGADIADVCSKVAEQAMQESLRLGQTMLITMNALEKQIKATKPSVSLEMLRKYEELQEKYGRRTLKSEEEPPEKKEKHTWGEIGGLDHVKRELMEAIETPLRKPELYEKYKIRPPRGVLLYGPPGCGKTLMAKVVASQCGAHFLSVDIKKESAEGIRKWFIRARENIPSILFFDEIDSIAASRDFGPMINQGVVTQLLVEMDGMEELKQIVVLAATNRPDQLDTALMRPGRFDRLIYIPPPDNESREKILRVCLKGKPLSVDVNLRTIAESTDNYSGADLSALCYEVSMDLIRKPKEGHLQIHMKDFISAMKKIKASITQEELTYYDEMKERYSRGG